MNEVFFADGREQTYGEYEVCATVNALARSGISVQDDGDLDFTIACGTGSIRIAETEAADPAAPDITRDSTYYDLSLYQIAVTTTGALSVKKDERTDVNVCGAIRARDTSELDTYIKSMQSNIESLADLQAVDGGRAIKVGPTEPTGVPAETLWFITNADGKVTGIKVK